MAVPPDEKFHCVMPENALPCASEMPANHMRVDDCNHTLPGAECNATCVHGFESNGGDRGFACDAGGRWVPKSLDPKRRLECTCPSGEAPDVDGGETCTTCGSDDERPGCGPVTRKDDPVELVALVAGVAGVALVLLWAFWRLDLCPVWLVDCLCPRPGHKPESVLRQSFLGSHKMVRLLVLL